MKIGLIIYGSLDTLSGGYLYDRQLVRYLRAAGCQVDILSLPWRNYPAHMMDILRLAWVRKIACSRYDLLLQDELNHPSLFILNPLLRTLTASPIVSIVHHLRSSEDHPALWLPIYRTVERRYLRSVDGFIFNSQTTRQIVNQVTGQIKPHIVAYPAADHRQPPAHGTVVRAITQRLHRGAPLQLLFVGNLTPRKGLHTLLRALGRVNSPNWHLHIVGSPEIHPDYSRAMHELGDALALSPKLTWHGRLSDQALDHIYETGDLLVMPSYEGFGIVYLEAMAYGLPVIATNAGAAPEVVSPGINGFLIPPDDDLSLARYLDDLLSNRVHLATLAYHARMRYEEHPTWEQSMGSAYQWLHEVLSS
ncbi:MAG: glycosyltransferase family 4 protein [Caldilineaceae bacterium]|nr:glycosyltransferase family 4 protein [Caldilineaceae bacterium]